MSTSLVAWRLLSRSLSSLGSLGSFGSLASLAAYFYLDSARVPRESLS